MTDDKIRDAASKITDLIDVLTGTAAGQIAAGVRNEDDQERQKIVHLVFDIIRECRDNG